MYPSFKKKLAAFFLSLHLEIRLALIQVIARRLSAGTMFVLLVWFVDGDFATETCDTYPVEAGGELQRYTSTEM